MIVGPENADGTFMPALSPGYVVPANVPEVSIVAEADGRLTFRAKDGEEFVFDLNTLEWVGD